MPSPEVRKAQLLKEIRLLERKKNVLGEEHTKVFNDLVKKQVEFDRLNAQEDIFIATRREAARTISHALIHHSTWALEFQQPHRVSTVMELTGPLGGKSSQVSFYLIVNGERRHVKCNIYDMTDEMVNDSYNSDY